MARLKRITKKKLKEPDEFVSFTEQAFLFITRHGRRIVSGGIVLLIILSAVFLYLRWEKKSEEEAYRKFSLAESLYQMVSSPYREGSPSDYKSVLDKFDEVVKKFPKTSYGKLSLLYQGNIHLRLGEFEEAIGSYQAFLQKAGREKLYRTFAMEGLGYSYEGKKEYERAVQSYEKVLGEGETFQLGDAYLSMGRCYEKLGKKKEALENYKAFLKASQRSTMTNGVLRKISILEN
ncbi:MAG: YfgM family protein [Thermodesulfobacteriota bacterium]